MVNSEHVGESPFMIQVVPGRTSPSMSCLTGPALTQVLTPEAVTVLELIAKDEYGNRRHTGGTTFESHTSMQSAALRIMMSSFVKRTRSVMCTTVVMAHTRCPSHRSRKRERDCNLDM